MGNSQTELLEDRHNVSVFDCGATEQNDFLRNLAGTYQKNNKATTYVLVDENDTEKVIGFYSVCTQHISADAINSKEKPAKRPAVLLGQLGVDKSVQGKKRARLLVVDFFKRSLQYSHSIAAEYLIVEVQPLKNAEQLIKFYENLMFTQATRTDTRKAITSLFIPISFVQRIIDNGIIE